MPLCSSPESVDPASQRGPAPCPQQHVLACYSDRNGRSEQETGGTAKGKAGSRRGRGQGSRGGPSACGGALQRGAAGRFSGRALSLHCCAPYHRHSTGCTSHPACGRHGTGRRWAGCAGGAPHCRAATALVAASSRSWAAMIEMSLRCQGKPEVRGRGQGSPAGLPAGRGGERG